MLKILKTHHLVGGLLAFTCMLVVILASIAVLSFVHYTGQRTEPSYKPLMSRIPFRHGSGLHQPWRPITPDFHMPPAEDGVAPVLTRIPTTQPVVFLGIDDGAYKDESVVQEMQLHQVKATLFLSDLFIRSDRDFFKKLTAHGSLVEDHTLSHDVHMTGMSYEQMKQEICGMADVEQEVYGRRPVLFRPPGGAYNLTMRQAANACGMKAIVTWVAKANGGSMQYQVGDSLRPGDIVLMHFRPEFKQDMKAFVEARDKAGLQTELLENWVL